MFLNAHKNLQMFKGCYKDTGLALKKIAEPVTYAVIGGICLIAYGKLKPSK